MLLRMVTIALFLLVGSATAAQPRESLMPQHQTLMNDAGTQHLTIDCRPVRSLREIECAITTTSLYVWHQSPPTTEERQRSGEIVASEVRNVRNRRPATAAHDEARARLEQWCRETTPAPSIGEDRRRALEGGFARHEATLRWRSDVCDAAVTCSGDGCVNAYEALLQERLFRVDSIPATTCVVDETSVVVRMRAAGTDRWEAIVPGECNTETRLSVERTFQPGRDPVEADERPTWRFTQLRRRIGPAEPDNLFCQLLETDAPSVFDSANIDATIAVQCDRVELRSGTPRPFSADVIEGFESKPEWVRRRDATCDSFDLSESGLDRYQRCSERFVREERRRRAR